MRRRNEDGEMKNWGGAEGGGGGGKDEAEEMWRKKEIPS